MSFFLLRSLLALGILASVVHAAAPQMLETYCLDCHDAETKKGKVDLDSIFRDEVSAHAEVWENVVRQLTARHMPPAGKKRPETQCDLSCRPATFTGRSFFGYGAETRDDAAP